MTKQEIANEEVKAYKWMVSKGYDRKASKDIAQILVKYKEEQLNIHSVSNRFDDQKFIGNVIGSYRHDFGLLDKQEQDKLRFECKEWMRAIKNNEPY